MFDNNLSTKLSEAFEVKIGGIFKKYKLCIKKLDKDKSGKRPDYLVTKGNGCFVCECKYIASSGLTPNGFHMSTLDPDICDSGVFSPQSSLKIQNVLLNARTQYIELVESDQKYKSIPFVVALESDFLVNIDNSIPKDIFGIKEISAVLKLEKDLEQIQEFKKHSIEEIKKIIEGKLKIKIPPKSVRFRVMRNINCTNKFQAINFLINPIIDGYNY